MLRLAPVLATSMLVLHPGQAPSRPTAPKIILIYADDLGYGGVSVFNPDHGLISTLHLDRLAGEGMFFTNAHSSSGVCARSRYSLMTGRHYWQTKL